MHRGDEKCIPNFGWKSQRKRNNLEDLGIAGRRILKWIEMKSGLGVWMRFIWLRIRSSGRFL